MDLLAVAFSSSHTSKVMLTVMLLLCFAEELQKG
jgi:hypothetical protein